MVRLSQYELEAQAGVMAGHPLWMVRSSELVEQLAVEQFVRTVTSLELAPDARNAIQKRVLGATMEMARAVDLSQPPGGDDRYGRRVLWEDGASGASIAAITLRYGQMTEAHDHNGWGCVVTIQGIERNRRLAQGADGELELIDERDYAAGEGYLFDMADIHQAIGADPDRETVALHVLVPDHASGVLHQKLHEHRHDHAHPRVEMSAA
jgi:predicted metal-dependent enzyme (double-stranded beta helix superfamily)